MSSQRRHESDLPRAKANGRSKDQRDSQTSDRKVESPERAEDKCAPKQERGSNKGRSKKEKDPHYRESEDRAHETPAPKRGTINKPNNKQTDLPNGERQYLELSESRSEEKHAALTRRASVSIHANNLSDNDRQGSAKSKPQSKRQTDSSESQSEDKAQQTTKSKAGEKIAPKRQSKNKRDISNIDREGSKSASEEKPVATPKTRHDSTTKTGFPEATNAQDASPAVSARNLEHQQKSAGKTATRGISVDDTLGKILEKTLDELKIKKQQRSIASSCVNNITDKVIAHLKRNTTWCSEIERLTTGSYYENLKICKPDEFDVMLTIPVDRVDIQPLSEARAFYSVGLKRHPKKHPLDEFLNENKIIKASEMLVQFRDAVKKALEKLSYKIEIKRKKARCPAVTLEVKEDGMEISIDFVLGLKVHRASWPQYTKDGFQIDSWLGKKEKATMKQKPFYLVPKYEGKGSAEVNGELVAKDAWRISFSHVEKEILKRHGHSKTCCEADGQKCCRRECLKLLKYLLRQLEDSKSEKMSSFSSYHAKTTLLHACATRANDSDWAYTQLAECFKQLLGDFVKCLRCRHLPNFFIPSHNLLHQASNCDFLANEIELQLDNNFPIFS